MVVNFIFTGTGTIFSSTALRHQMPIGVRKSVCVYESQNPFSPDKTLSLISPYSGSLQTEKVAERTFIRVCVKIQRHRQLLTLALGYTIMCIFFVFPVHIHFSSGRVVNQLNQGEFQDQGWEPMPLSSISPSHVQGSVKHCQRLHDFQNIVTVMETTNQCDFQ